jgi:hypothetical protein
MTRTQVSLHRAERQCLGSRCCAARMVKATPRGALQPSGRKLRPNYSAQPSLASPACDTRSWSRPEFCNSSEAAVRSRAPYVGRSTLEWGYGGANAHSALPSADNMTLGDEDRFSPRSPEGGLRLSRARSAGDFLRKDLAADGSACAERWHRAHPGSSRTPDDLRIGEQHACDRKA